MNLQGDFHVWRDFSRNLFRVDRQCLDVLFNRFLKYVTLNNQAQVLFDAITFLLSILFKKKKVTLVNNKVKLEANNRSNACN